MDALSAVYGHSQEGVGFFAVNLCIEEVAPSADNLTDEKSGNANIKYIQGVELFYSAVNKGGGDCTDKSAIDGESALPQLEDSQEASDGFPVKNAVVNSCTGDAENQAPQADVNYVVRVNATLFAGGGYK